jgi:hypothetical protein
MLHIAACLFWPCIEAAILFFRGFKHFQGGIPYALIRKMFKELYELIGARGNNSTKNELMKELPELADKIYIVPNSIDDHFFNSQCQKKP